MLKSKKSRCTKCHKIIKLSEVKVHNSNTGKKDILYLAKCDKCRHTIYGDLEELMVDV